MASLTPTQIHIIKATVPVLAEYGTAITTKFYADLLDTHPSLKSVFSNTHQATGHQARTLAGALYAYAVNIDNLGALSPALERICHKHASLFIRPEQYDVVGTHLLATMATVLGEAATPEMLDAWGAAYWQIANIMMAKEDGMYKATKGWDDWEDFKIAQKVRETEEITSFYLKPAGEGLKAPMFKPGQYVSVNMFVDDLDGGVWQARQYSLSDAPGKDYLRISVKREPATSLGEGKDLTYPGHVSNLLHDTKEEGDVVRISHPFGDMYFQEAEHEPDAPLVLISAGVGLTCLTSILNATVEKKSSRPVSWIHGARDAKSRAFKDDMDRLDGLNENVQTVYFSSGPKEGEMQGRHFDVRGRVDLDKLDNKVLFTDHDKAQYFLCGPTQFMLDIGEKLKSLGVSADRIKMELFSTGGVPNL